MSKRQQLTYIDKVLIGRGRQRKGKDRRYPQRPFAVQRGTGPSVKDGGQVA